MERQNTPWRGYLSVFLATALLMAAAGLTVGANLGVFFAGLFLSTLLLPWVIVPNRPLSRQLLAAACVTDAIALVWLTLTIADEQITLLYWIKAYLLLLALAAFQFGILRAARRLRLPGVLPPALSVVLILLWLTAPLWLLHHLQTPTSLPWMQRIIDVHPLFAMNTAVPLGVWTESPLAYRLLNLNQDVPYTLPPSPVAAILLHAVIGALLTCISSRKPSSLYK